MRCTVVITERQAAQAHEEGAEAYLKRRFLQDFGVPITGLFDPRLEFEKRTDDSAMRITFDGRDGVVGFLAAREGSV